MFLHYLGKHEHEPQKLCLFSHAVYRVSKTTLLWLAVILDTHQPIFIFFVDNKVVLLSTVFFSPIHFVFQTWYTA